VPVAQSPPVDSVKRDPKPTPKRQTSGKRVPQTPSKKVEKKVEKVEKKEEKEILVASPKRESIPPSVNSTSPPSAPGTRIPPQSI